MIEVALIPTIELEKNIRNPISAPPEAPGEGIIETSIITYALAITVSKMLIFVIPTALVTKYVIR